MLFALPVFYHFRAVWAVLHDKDAVLMSALFEPFPLWLAEWESPHLAAVPLVAMAARLLAETATAADSGILPVGRVVAGSAADAGV